MLYLRIPIMLDLLISDSGSSLCIYSFVFLQFLFGFSFPFECIEMKVV